jgi:hypothetical protein
MPSPIIKKMDSMSKKVTDLLPLTKSGFLTNRWILYLVLFAALFDIFYFYQRGDVQSVMVFFVVGILISFFSKNMVVILILAIVITHLIRYGKKLTEGFKEEEDKEDENVDEFEGGEPTETPDAEEFESNPVETTSTTSIASTDKAVNNTASALSQAELTTQTKELLSNQKDLMRNMQTLEPLLNKADNFLSRRKEKFTSLAEAYENHGATTKPTSK